MLTFHDNQIPAIVVNPTHTGHGILVLPNLDRQDYVILNSTANVQKAIDALGQYERIHCLLDNDGAGIRATQAITAEYSYRVRDFSHNYRGIFRPERLPVRQEAGTEKRTETAAKAEERQGNLTRRR